MALVTTSFLLLVAWHLLLLAMHLLLVVQTYSAFGPTQLFCNTLLKIRSRWSIERSFHQSVGWFFRVLHWTLLGWNVDVVQLLDIYIYMWFKFGRLEAIAIRLKANPATIVLAGETCRSVRKPKRPSSEAQWFTPSNPVRRHQTHFWSSSPSP